MVKPQAKKAAALLLQERHQFSERRACRLLKLSRTAIRHISRRFEDPVFVELLKKRADERPSWGYRQLLRRMERVDGVKMNSKKFRRIYKAEGLTIGRRKKSKPRSQPRVPMPKPTKPNQKWAMDFVSDQLGPSGRRFRVLTVIDEFTRECKTLYVDFSIPGSRVARALESIGELPASIRIDNGSEFTGAVMDQWAGAKEIKLDFINPGKPNENAFIESFNGKFRNECLNIHWFISLEDARRTIEEWRVDYNENRPHSSLGGLTPKDFAAQLTRRDSLPPRP